MILTPIAKPVRIRISCGGIEHYSLETLLNNYNVSDIEELIRNKSIFKWLEQIGELELKEKLQKISNSARALDDVRLDVIKCFYVNFSLSSTIMNNISLVNFWYKNSFNDNIKSFILLLGLADIQIITDSIETLEPVKKIVWERKKELLEVEDSKVKSSGKHSSQKENFLSLKDLKENFLSEKPICVEDYDKTLIEKAKLASFAQELVAKGRLDVSLIGYKVDNMLGDPEAQKLIAKVRLDIDALHEVGNMIGDTAAQELIILMVRRCIGHIDPNKESIRRSIYLKALELEVPKRLRGKIMNMTATLCDDMVYNRRILYDLMSLVKDLCVYIILKG